MTKPERLLGLLLACLAVLALCLFVALRKGRISTEAARRDSESLRTQIEELEAKLAILEGDYATQQNLYAATGSPETQTGTAAFSGLNHEIGQSSAQLSNQLAQLAANNTIESSEQKLQSQQRAISLLNAKVAKQQEIVDSAKSNLDQLVISLNVSDDIAAIDVASGLKTPSLRAYWPYYEARKYAEETEQFASVLKRKLQFEELEMATQTARSSENVK